MQQDAVRKASDKYKRKCRKFIADNGVHHAKCNLDVLIKGKVDPFPFIDQETMASILDAAINDWVAGKAAWVINAKNDRKK